MTKSSKASKTAGHDVLTSKSLTDNISGIIAELKLPTSFPSNVLQEAEAITETIPKAELKRRRDLRGQVTVTIDGDKARDFDDAVSVEDIGQDRIRLRVSIADVSHFVSVGSTIDKEARARGTSVYFPDRVLPMLPEKLSNQLCSLVPEQDRLAFTAELDINKSGDVERTAFYKSVIRSDYRLTYHQVAHTLVDKDQETRHQLRHVLRPLELMETLYFRMRKSRLERGSLDFDLPEPDIILDLGETQIEDIVKAERTQAHMMIEEFMIAANEAVARFLTEQGVPTMYRIHEQPTREKLQELQVTLHNLGYALKVSKKTFDPKALSAIIKKAHGKPESRMINTLLLRSLAKAIYSTENAGHFGLASSCYTHFTSPIRRYPDLMVHRILADILESDVSAVRKSQKKRQKPPPATFDVRRLSQIAEHSSLRERAAMEAEWAVRDLVSAVFMEQYVGETFSGIISGVTKFGLFVELGRYFVQGLIHIRQLDDDFYIFNEDSHTLFGKRTRKKYRIGDSVWIRVRRVDVEKRWVDFEPAAKPADSIGTGP